MDWQNLKMRQIGDRSLVRKGRAYRITHQVERFILAGGGVYGSVENWAIVQKVRNQGKLKSVIRRIWLPYEGIMLVLSVVRGEKIYSAVL